MDLSIIIVNWNSKDYLQKCIASILESIDDITFEIVVIDSGSFDGAGAMLKQYYPQVRFIQSERNLGFAKANNEAYRESRGQHLLFLNPDTELTSRAINIMFNYLSNLTNVGAIGCKLLNADKTVQTSCIQAFPTILNQFLDSDILRTFWPELSLWGNAPLFSVMNRPREVEAISGACLMVKRTVFEDVQYFSEDYFMYAEDLDLCYKIKHQGYKNYYIPEAHVIHFGGGSTRNGHSDFSVVMMRESIWKFMKRTRGKFYGLAYRVTILFSAVSRLVLLVLALPIYRVGRDWKSWNVSFNKWKAILTWSLGYNALIPN